MKPSHHSEPKLSQVERIAFFSDALVAIAVTLLIIEIKAPHIEAGASFADQLSQLQHLLPEFISFIISFVIIITQWVKHHELFGNIVRYDSKLITLNSIFLFSVTIIPFSTSYFAHNNLQEFFLPYLVYGATLIALTLCNYFLFRHATNMKHNLCDPPYSPAQVKWLTTDYLVFPSAILLGLAVGMISLKAGLFAYVAVIFIGSYLRRKKKNRAR